MTHPFLRASVLGLVAALCVAGCASNGDDDDDDRDRRTTRRRTDDRSRTSRTDRRADTIPPASTSDQSADTATTTPPPAPATTIEARDVESLTFLIALDEHEVQVATDAQNKGARDDVLEFARMMQTEHGRHADDTRILARDLGLTLTDPSSVTTLRQKVAAARTDLLAKEGADFDRAYAEAMVTGHQDALVKIDEYLALISSERIRSHLTATRTVIAHHLELAKKLTPRTSP